MFFHRYQCATQSFINQVNVLLISLNERNFNDENYYIHIMRHLLFIPLLFVLFNCYGQDISGKWTGNFGKNFSDKDVNKLIINLELYNDSLVKGTSRLEYESAQYEYYIIKGVYRKQDSTIYFSEDREIDVNMGMASTVMGNYTMKLKVYDTVMRFEGKWRENGEGLLSQMATRVWLEKSIKKEQPINPAPELKTIVESEPEKFRPEEKQIVKKEREIIIQRQIEIDTIEQDTIRIDIIDNAKIDNDVISLYLDDNLLINRATISSTPITFYFYLSRERTYRSLRLVAESYGNMPPCTAHMKVTTCQSLHRFDLRSTYQSDAVVEFYLKGTKNANPTSR